MVRNNPNPWGLTEPVQLLVYFFIALTGVAVAAAAYFGLTFSVIEAALAALSVFAVLMVMYERTLRRRTEARLRRGIEDLSRLLSTDAQAGQVLSQRINELAKSNAAQRIADLEADLSVLGTVVQQIAEAMAEMESREQKYSEAQGHKSDQPLENDEGDRMLSIQDVRRAMQEDRVECRLSKIVDLPDRQLAGYDVVAAIELPNGEFVAASDIVGGREGAGLMQSLERMTWTHAINLAEQAASAENEARLFAPVSRATLSDPGLVGEITGRLDRSKAAAARLSLMLAEPEFRRLNPMERGALAALISKGVGLSLSGVSSLRLNFAELSELGVNSVRVDAGRFINNPESYTDFHTSDVVDYVNRYEVELVAVGVRSEQQILSLVEDGVRYVSGKHIAPLRAIPSDLFGSVKRGLMGKSDLMGPLERRVRANF